MKKIEAVIQPYKLGEVKEALAEIGVTTLTMTEVREADCHGGHTEVYRGQRYTVDFTPRVKVEVLVPNNRAERAIAVITKAANTGHDDSGTIAISPLDEGALHGARCRQLPEGRAHQGLWMVQRVRQLEHLRQFEHPDLVLDLPE